MNRGRFLFLSIVLCALIASAAPTTSFRVVKTVTLGGEGGWDYLTFDPDANRVFITRGTHVIVVDKNGKQIGDIPNTPGAHGVALAPEFHRGFISDGGNNTVTQFDLKSLAVVGPISVGTRPDAIAYDSASKRVFTFNAASHDATAIDAATGAVVGTVPLEGKPEFAVSDGAGRMFVNIEDKSELVAFSPKDLKVLNRWPLKPCDGPSGLAIDAAHHRLFSGCDNETLAVVDADSGRVVQTVHIGAGVDAVKFDNQRQLAFSSNGRSGTLTIIHEDSPDKYTVTQDLQTARGARTQTLDDKTHTVYLVTAQFDPAPPATAENPRPRPRPRPGTFELLIVREGK
jgi:DNA-binding beta-propeller fold protein YncE